MAASSVAMKNGEDNKKTRGDDGYISSLSGSQCWYLGNYHCAFTHARLRERNEPMSLELSTEKAHDVVIIRWLWLEYNRYSRPGMLSYCAHLWSPPWTPSFAPHTPAPWCHPSPEWYQTPSYSTKFSCHFLNVDSVLDAGGRSDHTLKSLVSSSKGSRHTPQRQPWYHDRGRCCKQVQADQRGAVLLQLEGIRRLTWGKSLKGLALSLDTDAGQCDAEWRRAIGNTWSAMTGYSGWL